MFTLPVPASFARTVTVLYGVLVFIWLSPEESQVWPVALLGIGLAGLTIMWTVGKWLGGRELTLLQVAALGLLAGALVGLGGNVAASALMFFKNALHAHAFPDFPPRLLLALLSRAPLWAVAGGLAGLGAALLWLARKQS